MRFAIYGHETRGAEVISVLEMLGGRNSNCLKGGILGCIYHLKCNLEIDWRLPFSEFKSFTLEEFQSSFPYKIGDVVNTVAGPVEITKMNWDSSANTVKYGTSNHFWFTTSDIVSPDVSTEVVHLSDISGDIVRLKIPDGYQFVHSSPSEIVFRKVSSR